MLAWIKSSIYINYMLIVGAVFLLITTDANPTEIAYKVCRNYTVIAVGTRKDERSGTSSCTGCDRLRECTSVVGSVHLKGISFSESSAHLRRELHFPKLREITGHLIVTFLEDGATSVSDILPNLAVIHGRVENQFLGYALVVYKNKGLQNLGLNSLTLVKQGGIKIEFNPKLCYLDRIRWQALMDNGQATKYELAMKGNSKDCFPKCSESCRTPSGQGSSSHIKYCWGRNQKNCQKLCDVDCGSRGCEDGSVEKCCHKECLGGCTKANSPHHCNACQHLRIKRNGSCVATCPPGLKELEEFICVEDCPEDNILELNGKCYKNSPVGYKNNGSKLVKCNDCPRECVVTSTAFPFNVQKINTLADSAQFKGCTIIKGSLEIEMRNVPGGTNVAKVLNEHFGSVKTIKGYLVVRESTPLISLDFFKNLTTIQVRRGYGFSAKDYALAIYENPNLESLWNFHADFKITGTAFTSGNGGVFVQLNPRLCLREIYPLIENVLKLNRSNPAVDVSETTNGNSKTCNVHFVNLTITPNVPRCKGICVKVSWPNKAINDDYRNVLLYTVWYRETTRTDLSEYDDVDACNSDHVWNRRDHKRRGSTAISIFIRGLKAHTLYAFRLEAIVIAGTGVKSHITYFKTRQTKPSMPRNLEVNFLSSSSLHVNWKKPFFPNGDITHYVVRYHEIESSHLWNIKINWCTAIDSSNLYGTKAEEKPEEGTSMNSSCPVNITCDCENGKDKQETPDAKEALFDKQFQDKLFSTVFTKHDDNDKDETTRPPTVRTFPNVVRNKTTVSQGCDNDSKNSSCFNATSKTPPKSNPTTVMTSQPSTFPVVIKQRNVTSQQIILTGLNYFTEHTVEVCACNGAGCAESRLFVTGCSTAVGRTGKSDMADDVGNTLSVTVKEKKFTLNWKAPERPNGVVFIYEILITYRNNEENKTITMEDCVTAPKTSYEKPGASFGDYTAKVRAKTPVGNGSWSNEVTFNITEYDPTRLQNTEDDVNLVTVIGVSIAAVLAAVVVFAAFTYSFIQRQKKHGNATGVLFSSTNPEYWNCSEVYVPDEWEVPRHNITLIRELGNGSFGMVWEGEAVGILPGVDSCKVAVKTVSDNSSIRDKVEFLKEASIMKAFNCNHVLRLLGVVSAGDPVLVIMELMENGDLKSFLRRRRPDAEEECDLPPPTDIELYQMAAEIADGMAYLAERKFVHRDLAARNCMVSGNYTCKIGDFGMARDVYETDYYRKGGKGFLPVRWMAPESLKDGVFCSASDVWSYGVVLWEMATLAEQPYQGKSNEEVMKYVLDSNCMDIPETCPRKLLELMLLCWQYKAKLRPSFVSIVENLEGYLSIEFTERSFYHNGRSRNETDTSSLVSLGTENDDISELQDITTDERNHSPRESFV